MLELPCPEYTTNTTRLVGSSRYAEPINLEDIKQGKAGLDNADRPVIKYDTKQFPRTIWAITDVLLDLYNPTFSEGFIGCKDIFWIVEDTFVNRCY